MRLTKNLFLAAVGLSIAFVGCKDDLEPMKENIYTMEEMLSSPSYAEGFLIKAYKAMPIQYSFDEDVASDDAVTNVKGSSISNMNTGGWTASSNPLGNWEGAYERISYINTFNENYQNVEWSFTSDLQQRLYIRKFAGEIHGLRAWNYFELLKRYAGEGSNGELYGVPLVDKVLTGSDNLEIPRATFKDCIDFILADLKVAIDSLPVVWKNYSNGSDPATVEADGDSTSVFGTHNLNRITGLAARVLKSNVLLYAASPAYASASGYTWEDAAEAAADVIDVYEKAGGSLSANDLKFYANKGIKEVIWRSNEQNQQNGWETSNFPPSRGGNGNVNPTQDLVNAFGTASGYPLDEVPVGDTYDENFPYNSRDPRLDSYIVYNGASFNSNTIWTYPGAIDPQDAPGMTEKSTRTSYYLRKFMDESVVLIKGQEKKVGNHYMTYARYTEALLNFAEAAFEANLNFDEVIGKYSSRQVINMIRSRAGISSDYVDGLSNSDKIRKLIRNERRIELCFEGQRFYDIRRWKDLTTMKKSVSGVFISNDMSVYDVRVVEARDFDDYMIYGPIPFNETLKYNLMQNKGW